MRKNRFQSSSLLVASTLSCATLVGSACSDTKSDLGSGGSGGSAGWTYLPPGADAGTTSAGGTASGNGGGGSAGSAGSAGYGGSVVTPTPFACDGKRPNQPLITSFDGFLQDRWQSPGNVDGGIYVYPEPLMAKPGEFLRFSDPVATYTGVGVWFAGCIDASKHKGLRFTMFGDVGSTKSLQFYLVVNRNRDVDVENSVGACIPTDPQDVWQSCRPPTVRLSVSAEPTTQTVLWTDFKGGIPSEKTDGSDVLALQWSFDWSEGEPSYDAQLTIDDLEFVTTDEPGMGGAGGAGGAAEGGAGGVPDGGVGNQ